MESAGLDLWAGLDRALFDDGDGCMVGLENMRLGQGFGVLWNSARFQRSMDAALFRGTSARLGLGRYHRNVGIDFGDDDCVFPSEQNSGWVDGAVFRVGEFCDGVELHVVADELVN